MTVQAVTTEALSDPSRAAILRVCDAAYRTDTRPYFEALRSGTHLLGFVGGRLVSHLMWVTRWLEPEGREPLCTAYVEMVATEPAWQRQGYASELLREFPNHVGAYDVAALCPATEGLYLRQGWRFWTGPLFARRDGGLEPTPGERVMLLALPRTPALNRDSGLSVEWRPGEIW